MENEFIQWKMVVKKVREKEWQKKSKHIQSFCINLNKCKCLFEYELIEKESEKMGLGDFVIVQWCRILMLSLIRSCI